MIATGEPGATMTDSERAVSGSWRWWHMLAVDLRSLALFRVALGTCLLIDLAGHIPQIDDFYTDAGILPRDALISQFGQSWARGRTSRRVGGAMTSAVPRR